MPTHDDLTFDGLKIEVIYNARRLRWTCIIRWGLRIYWKRGDTPLDAMLNALAVFLEHEILADEGND